MLVSTHLILNPSIVLQAYTCLIIHESPFDMYGERAVLCRTFQEVSSSLSEGVVHIVEGGLKSGQVSVRSCAVQGLLYLLQGPPEDSPPLIMLAANYILKYNDG